MRTNLILRWLALASVIANVTFSFTYHSVFGLPEMSAVTDNYSNLFVPAGYAFSIWGLIYLLWITYAVYTLMPSQRLAPVHDRLTRPVLISSLLGIGWIFAFTQQMFVASVLIIFSMLTTSLVLFTRAHQAIAFKGRPTWFRLPFSIYAAWLCVACIANMTILFVSYGWAGGDIGSSGWFAIMTGIAVVLAMFMNARYRDMVFPLVTLWAVFSLFIRHKDSDPADAKTALAFCLILFAWEIISYLASLFRNPLVVSR